MSAAIGNPERHRRIGVRRGATAIEMALVMMTFIILVVGMLDLGLAVFRGHLLSFAARAGARAAIVHGEYANRLGSWGPTAVSGTMDSSFHPLVSELTPYLYGMTPSSVTLQLSWPDGTNEVEERVQVALTTNYTPMTTLVLGGITIPLSASSTMRIAH